jgi:hypothetical protein
MFFKISEIDVDPPCSLRCLIKIAKLDEWASLSLLMSCTLSQRNRHLVQVPHIEVLGLYRSHLIHYENMSLTSNPSQKNYTDLVNFRTNLCSNHISCGCFKGTEEPPGACQSSDHRGSSI